jgi:hypothetical protein
MALAKPGASTAPVGESVVSEAARRSPASWAEAIRGLLRAGKPDAACAELRRLQAAYPSWPLPKDLRALAEPAGR